MLTVTVTARHLALDLGLPLNLTGAIATSKTVNYSWAGLPKGCPVHPANLTINCVPNVTGRFNVTLTLVNNKGLYGSDFKVITITNAPSANVTLLPTVGRAPLTVAFNVSVVGGAAPLTISWITSDGSIASGVNFTHTFGSAGSYSIDLWVNDSTVPFNPNGSFAGVYFLNVSAAPPYKGLLGLPDHDGEYLIVGIVGVLFLIAVYQALSRRRPTRLPPAENWMRPPERSGGPPRPKAPPPEPPVNK